MHAMNTVTMISMTGEELEKAKTSLYAMTHLMKELYDQRSMTPELAAIIVPGLEVLALKITLAALDPAPGIM